MASLWGRATCQAGTLLLGSSSVPTRQGMLYVLNTWCDSIFALSHPGRLQYLGSMDVSCGQRCRTKVIHNIIITTKIGIVDTRLHYPSYGGIKLLYIMYKPLMGYDTSSYREIMPNVTSCTLHHPLWKNQCVWIYSVHREHTITHMTCGIPGLFPMVINIINLNRRWHSLGGPNGELQEPLIVEWIVKGCWMATASNGDGFLGCRGVFVRIM